MSEHGNVSADHAGWVCMGMCLQIMLVGSAVVAQLGVMWRTDALLVNRGNFRHS